MKIVDRDNYRVIRISGFLDGRTQESVEVHQFLDNSLDQVRGHHVLDLSEAEYVNSSMLGQFLRFLQATQERGCRVLLLAPPPSVANVLTLTGLNALLPIVNSEDEIEALLDSKSAGRSPRAEIDYDELADEIEDVIKGGSSPAKVAGPLIRRILGDS